MLPGAVSVMSSDGDWGPINSFEGLLLLAVVLGFHRSMSGALTIRTCLMRAAFGLAVSFSLCIGVGWPVVRAGGDVYLPEWVSAFTVLGVLLAVVSRRSPGSSAAGSADRAAGVRRLRSARPAVPVSRGDPTGYPLGDRVRVPIAEVRDRDHPRPKSRVRASVASWTSGPVRGPRGCSTAWTAIYSPPKVSPRPRRPGPRTP